ncbi:SAM-dependent methyltransferase [Marivirga lumbricoides]|uniref:SAM-dependent methyltransferase n=1 Tax=Marivirga lumbricoides TaxID=1046115 RepID=A0A2T4DDC5_9BACT|nr:SAM-dependent methyltransferase [Marivirga lumbricoides]
MHWRTINQVLGNIDLYWLDFILKGYLGDKDRILDVGCGEGRNLVYCMRQGYDVFGIDKNTDAIKFLRILGRQLKLSDVEARFQVMDMSNLRFPDHSFDVIINSAVLHFANDEEHFLQMFKECLRVLKPGAKLFIRTMTDAHFADNEFAISAQNLSSEYGHRFVLNESLLNRLLCDYPIGWFETPKNVIVGNERSMSVFILEKKNNA